MCIALIIFIWMAAEGRSRREPIYEGKKLSVWLMDHNSYNGGLSESGQRAIQAMGTNAIPHLLQKVGRKDSTLKLRIRAWAGRGSIIRRLAPTHIKERMRGVAGFKALGQQGAPAVPSLVKMLGDDRISYEAALSLAAVGPPAVPALIDELTNQNPWIRSGANQALNFMRSTYGAEVTEKALPSLFKLLDDPEPWVRGGAAITLGDMQRQPQLVIPALTKMLMDTNESVRASAARAVGLFGQQAQEASVPLEKLQSDPSPKVRQEAGAALNKITANSARP